MKTQYQRAEENGVELPPQMGSTGDDRMDLANVIGSDLGLSMGQALCAAERILQSSWYCEALSSAWIEGHGSTHHAAPPYGNDVRFGSDNLARTMSISGQF